ncbi:MAG: imidazole glycerol phosphate synthase subunit HisH [Gemmatimonadales bacterium]|nr:imidazole glycerol phosphate synthase subunit HisH [Gemmatimonadales bacterium]
MIAVVDYGVNNVKSVVRAIEAGGHAATLVTDAESVRRADRVLLPGVGHFGQAMRNLAAAGLDDAVRDAAASGRPVMGICLGLQLFFAGSDEAPDTAGLGLLPGWVRRFETSLPVPHVGWAEVSASASGRTHPVLAAVFQDTSRFFYHVHSFHPHALPDEAVLATGDYDGPFPSIAGRDNVIGAQFHPEKSQRAGIDLLAAFARWRP